MRDVAEHIDEYAPDDGRNKDISRMSLEVSTLDDTTFEWLGIKLDANEALTISEKLFDASKVNPTQFEQMKKATLATEAIPGYFCLRRRAGGMGSSEGRNPEISGTKSSSSSRVGTFNGRKMEEGYQARQLRRSPLL